MAVPVEAPPAPPPMPGRAPFSAVLSGSYRWLTLTIMAGTVIGSMDTYIVNTSMPRVLAELGQPEFYAWVASAFVLAQIVGLAVAGAWKDRGGLRTPFLITVAAFGVSSLLCAFAPSMALLVLARAIQGLAGGGLGALGFAAAASYPEALRLRMFSLISGVWGVLALGAPLLGGVITDTLGWRWIFLVNVPLCALVLLLAWWAIARSAPSAAGPRRALPIVRSVLLAVAVGGLTAAPSARSEASIALLGVGVVAAVVFAIQERRAAVPIIPLDTWRNRGPLGSSMLATLFYTGAYVGAGVFLPLYLVEIRGESTTHAGLVLSVGGSMWTVGSIIAATRGHGRWPMRMALGGAVLISLACASVAVQALLGNLPLPLIYIAWGAAGFGVGIAVLHLMNWAIVYSPADQSGAVSSAIQTMRMLGSAAVGALMGALLNAIGTAPGQLHVAIAAIFSLTALIALWPATLGRPRIGQRAEQPVIHSEV